MKGGGGGGLWVRGAGSVRFWKGVIAELEEQLRGERQFRIRIAATEMRPGPL